MNVCVQAEDRAHRLGQQGCVQVRYLIAPGTVDDAMWPLLGRKLQVVGKALDGHATGTATGKPSSNKTLSKNKNKNPFFCFISANLLHLKWVLFTENSSAWQA